MIGKLGLIFYLFVFTSNACCQSSAVDRYALRSVLFYNVENLFDTINDPITLDEAYTPDGRYNWTAKRYFHKLNRIARTITEFSIQGRIMAPDIIGLCEVENRSVLEDLVNNPKMVKYGYGIIQKDSPDARGIDVALIYKKSAFQPTSFQHHELYLYNEVNERQYTRDQLVVGGLLDNEEIYFIVNHWPSRRGGQQRSNAFRIEAARLNLKIIDSIRKVNWNPRILILGDFNDNPGNDSMKFLVQQGQLYNPMETLLSYSRGTLNHNFQWNLFDQILFSTNFFETENKYFKML